MQKPVPYTQKFYDFYFESSFVSASEVVPYIVNAIEPSSVLEIGSGTGAWSLAVLNCGIDDVMAVDGDWVREEALRIPKSKFVVHNLTEPFFLGRVYDLCICLEVGEHLTSAHADTLVTSLVSHAPIVLFSAAVPLQGGISHTNEQWPVYWHRKFQDHGYRPFDIVRPKFWNNDRVAYYYKQNAFLYVGAQCLDAIRDRLQRLALNAYAASSELMFIHPEKYLQLASFENVDVKSMFKAGPKVFMQALQRRLRRFERL
jgi:hypothetical protein